MEESEQIVIVLAEDDHGHARLIERNLRSVVTNKIVRFANGKEALEYLRREEHAPRQHVLLLDLNMPVMNGYQVLGHLRTNEKTRHIPVIVLATTDEPEEIQRCYGLGCNSYVVKPTDFDEFTEAMKRLGLFLTVTMMPCGGRVRYGAGAVPRLVG